VKKYIYLDHNATTKPRPEVVEAMLPHLKGHYGNASSLYALGQEERKAIDIAREQVTNLIHAANPEEIVFTGGGSESINWAIKGVALANRARGKHLVTTQIEHSAVIKAHKYMENLGWQVTYVGVDAKGRVSPADVDAAITPQTTLVSVMHANNEIGTMQPIEDIARICHAKGVPLHVDGLQTVGKILVDVKTLDVDLLSIGAHKFYGPKGVGALYIRPGTRLDPLLHGGSHERNRRAGTENAASIAGMGVAAAYAKREMRVESSHVKHLRDRLEKGLLKRIPHTRINGDPENRLFNTSNLSIESIEGEGLIVGLDMQGICVSSGSACSSGATEVSHVLKAIGLPLELAKGSVRLSLGRENTEEEIDRVLEVLPTVVERLRALSPIWSDIQKGIRKSLI
jgi:cysteine desulfurase